MEFTYDFYIHIINLLKKQGYYFTKYYNWQKEKRCVILRHDIDNDILKALDLAKIENKQGIASTYFVLLTSDFYNVFSRKNTDYLKQIINLGHDIGLHFDELNYPDIVGDKDKIIKAIIKEAEILSEVIQMPVKTVSMHRPSKAILESNLEIPKIINSYSKVYFKDFKYLSDSRRRWREPVEDIIKSGYYDHLHILTHAFWYNSKEISMSRTIKNFIAYAGDDRYNTFKENFTDLDNALKSL